VNKYNKTYYEIYAALVLSKISFLPNEFNIDWIQDKPDIQVGNIGVEVTSDAPKKYRSKLSIVNNLFNHGYSSDEKTDILKTLDKKGILTKDFSDDKNIVQLPVYKDAVILVNAIENKEVKYQEYSKQFPNCALFIFSYVFMLDIDEYKITEALKDKKYSFCPIFILSNDILFIWDNNSLSKQEVGEYLRNFNRTTMNYNDKYFDRYGKRK
jgi:hypothetical protein